jgi:hypothetical protein
MKRLAFLVLASFVGIALLAIGCGDTGGTTPQAEPAASAPAEAGAADRDAAESKPPPRRRRTSRAPQVSGLARVQILAPATKVEGDEVISTIRVRNVSKGSITQFSVSEFWYDDQGNATPGGSRTHRKPFMPGEVIEMELRTSKNPKFYQNQFEFSHANGDVKATVVASLPKPGED